MKSIKVRREFLLIIPCLFTMAGCGGSNLPTVTAFDEKTITVKKYDSPSSSFVDAGTLKTGFFNNSFLPYIEVKDYINYFFGTPSVYYAGYSVSYNNKKITFTNLGTNATCVFDLDDQSIYIGEYAKWFAVCKDASGVVTPGSEILQGPTWLYKFADGGELNYIQGMSHKKYIRLKDYNFKGYYYNEKAYLPLHLLSSLMLSDKSTPVYNGKNYYEGSLYNDDASVMAVNYINAECSSYKCEEYFKYNYDITAFQLDLKFGLKEHVSRDTYETVYYLQNGAYSAMEEYRADMISTEVNKSNNAYKRFFNEKLHDGGHTSYKSINLNCDKTCEIGKSAEEIYFSNIESKLTIARKAAGVDPETLTGKTKADCCFQVVNNVAYLGFDSFDIPYSDVIEPVTESNYYTNNCNLITYANDYVRSHTNIKDIVFDLSLNGGGAGIATLYALSWINKGKAPFTVSYSKEDSITSGIVSCDINRDGQISDADYLANDINIYVITSPNSFSCGNYLPYTIQQYVSKAKFIGSRSGGGCCNNDGTLYSPLGATYSISGLITLVSKNSSTANIVTDDDGVSPSWYPISLNDTDFEKYYDRETISQKITQKND